MADRAALRRRGRDQTRAGFTLRMMEGDHFYLQARRDAVIAAIRDDLALLSVAPSVGSTA